MAYLTALVLLIVFTRPAHAYIDPGSGSYMLQISLALLLAAVYTLKAYWQRLRASVSWMMGAHHRPGTGPQA